MKSFLLSAILILPHLLIAQPMLVTPGGGVEMMPAALTVFNNKLVYFAYSPGYGSELWVYDGVNSPYMAADINPGPGDGNAIGMASPLSIQMAVLNNKLYFPATDGNCGYELFEWDGVNAPRLIKDVIPGIYGSTGWHFGIINNKLYYEGAGDTTDTTHEYTALWIYDPIPDSSYRLFNIIATQFTDAWWPYYQFHGTVFNGRYWFLGGTDSVGNELMSYDPSIGTLDTFDLNAGQGSSNPVNFTVIGNDLYFSTYRDSSGFVDGLYKVGASGVPQRLLDVRVGKVFTYNIAAYNNKIFLAGIGSSFRCYDFVTNTLITIDTTLNSPCEFKEYNGRLYFTDLGRDLYSYDGNAIVKELSLPPLLVRPDNFIEFNNTLYFAALGLVPGTSWQLYKLNFSTGVTEAAVVSSTNLYPNPSSGSFTFNTSVSGRLLIIDLEGSVVESFVISKGKNEVKLSGWAPRGVYIASFISDDGTRKESIKLTIVN